MEYVPPLDMKALIPIIFGLTTAGLQNLCLAAQGVPVLQLTKAKDYGRIVQRGIMLDQRKTYLFSCVVPGAFQLGPHDHIPEFRSTTGDKVVTSKIQINKLGGWTRLYCTLKPSKTASFNLYLSLWSYNLFEVSNVYIGEYPKGNNLVRNPTFAEGLKHWETDGGQLKISRAIVSQAKPVQFSGRIVEYRRFDKKNERLVAYVGKKVVLLVPQKYRSKEKTDSVLQILDRLDKSWDYYEKLTGRRPAFGGDRIKLDGRSKITTMPTLASVIETCGAGCGQIGGAGIEIGNAIWDETYNNHSQGKETRGVFEYEMGRNFWFYGSILESKQAPKYHLATAFATIHGHLAGVEGGSTTLPGNENVDWVQSFRDAFTEYRKTPNFAKILEGGQPSAKILGGLWLHLGKTHGPAFHQRFFRAAENLPPAKNLSHALNNFVIASSKAANRNLTQFFINELKYPLVIP